MIDYKKVAEYCLKNWPNNCKHILRVADEVCENKFIFDMPWDMERTIVPAIFDKEIDWLFKPNSDMEFTYQFNRHRFFLILGQAYNLTLNNKYASAFDRLINHWIDNVPYNNLTRNSAWRNLEVGLRGEYWTQSLKLFNGCSIVEKSLDKIYESLNLHKQILLEDDSDRKIYSNWGVIQNHGLFDIALFAEDKKSMDIAITRLLLESTMQLMNDGVHWEQSSMYHAEVLKCFLDVAINAKLSNIELPKELICNIEKMANVSVAWQKPNFKHPLMGDSDDTDTRDLLCACALVFENGVMKGRAFDMLDFETVWLVGMDGVERFNKIEKVEPSFQSIALEDSGNYYLRSDWGKDANYLHFANGHTGGGHGHMDKLHMDLIIKGEEILVDAGRYTYVDCKYRRQLKGVKQHNTLSVNHKDNIKHMPTSQCWGYSKTCLTVKQGMFRTTDYEIVSGGHLGYSNFVGRTIIWIKPDIYIVIDNFECKGLNLCSNYWHFDCGAKTAVDGNKLIVKKKDLNVELNFFGGTMPKLKQIKSSISYHYNDICDNVAFSANNNSIGRNNIITIIGESEKIQVKPLEIFGQGGFKKSKKTYSGFEIKNGKTIYTVIICHKELMEWVKTEKNIGAIGRINIYRDGKLIGRHW